jgi:hypothetical protein
MYVDYVQAKMSQNNALIDKINNTGQTHYVCIGIL